MALKDRFQKAWNAFFNRDETENRSTYQDYGIQTYYRPDRPRFVRGSEKTIITAIFNRIALDVASANINHVRVDDEDKFLEIIDSGQLFQSRSEYRPDRSSIRSRYCNVHDGRRSSGLSTG